MYILKFERALLFKWQEMKIYFGKGLFAFFIQSRHLA